MCGIFGAVVARRDRISPDFVRRLAERLFRLSEKRGREAAGLVVHDGHSIRVLKQAGSVDQFLRSRRFDLLIDSALAGFQSGNTLERPGTLAFAGHSRLVTNGFQTNDENNQPVISHGGVGLHNGIIVNHESLGSKYPALVRKAEVDTEVLVGLTSIFLDETRDARQAVRLTFAEIQGSASLAFFADTLDSLVLATNTGSLFYLTDGRGSFTAFASERFTLARLMGSLDFRRVIGECVLAQLQAGRGLVLNLEDLHLHEFALAGTAPLIAATNGFVPGRQRISIVDHTRRSNDLRRCTRCILPESYPLIDFDAGGVCNYCRRHQKIRVHGREALERAVEPYRSKDGSPDCIVALSGGRDSTYGLHYIKTELGMNPVAFTYDWGMVTDLARRNQARICGALGIEHIVRSADIAAKRRYIRKNIEAWLRRPELGMVTLFTAGDKEFYRHARALRKETGIKLVVFCTGNMIEDTPYKTGLCGIHEDDHQMTLTGLSFRNKTALAWYYLRNYLRNPAYFNESLWDTLYAYWCTFVVKDDFLYLYHYLRWDEATIVSTIRERYDWELATDTTTTWRIGDGSAAFYNYIYSVMAGWSEDEVMLSNQVREGHYTRDQALERGREYSRPRYPSIREYAQLVGFNCEEALSIINAAPRRY